MCDVLTHAAEIFISRLMWETEASVPLTHTEYLRLQRQKQVSKSTSDAACERTEHFCSSPLKHFKIAAVALCALMSECNCSVSFLLMLLSIDEKKPGITLTDT